MDLEDRVVRAEESFIKGLNAALSRIGVLERKHLERDAVREVAEKLLETCRAIVECNGCNACREQLKETIAKAESVLW